MGNNAILSTGGGGGIGGSTGSVDAAIIIANGTVGNTVQAASIFISGSLLSWQSGFADSAGFANLGRDPSYQDGGTKLWRFNGSQGTIRSAIPIGFCTNVAAFATDVAISRAASGVLLIDGGQSGGGALLQLSVYTVGTLPAATTAGRKTFVSDALAPSFGVMVAGSGAVFTPVYSDGTNWIVG